MEEKEKNTLLRTKWNILRNLDAINDCIDASGLPIQDHMVLDDIKDSLKGLKYIKDLVGNAAAVTRVPV